MSIIFMATSLTAVGATVVTAGAFALRNRLAARKKRAAEAELTPIESFASEHSALAGVAAASMITGTSDTYRWNTLRLDDPVKAVAEFSALQAHLTQSGAVDSSRLNASIALSGGKSDDT